MRAHYPFRETVCALSNFMCLSQCVCQNPSVNIDLSHSIDFNGFRTTLHLPKFAVSAEKAGNLRSVGCQADIKRGHDCQYV